MTAMTKNLTTYEETHPWICWRYGRTHDRWWPPWSSTRLTGVAKIDARCAVCGGEEVIAMRIPRRGPVPEPAGGRHQLREKFIAEHAHPDRGAPMSWALPLLNPAAHPGGIDLAALGMRLEGDLNERPTGPRTDRRGPKRTT